MNQPIMKGEDIVELSAIVKTLHHTEAMFKTAYILRDDLHSEYDDVNYNQSYRGKTDFVYSNIVLAKGMTEKYNSAEYLINSIETDRAVKWKTSGICRDFMLNMDNSLVKRNNDNTINKTETKLFIKDKLDDFFYNNFSKDGYAVIYAVHFNDENNNHKEDNFHVHALVLCNQYNDETKSYNTKSYLDNNGKWIYRNPLDDRSKSSNTLKNIRSNWAKWQNDLLIKTGVKNHKVEYQSFKTRGIDKMKSYHLKRYHYEELQNLKKQYSYIEDIVERNEKIINDRNGKLTKRQIHNLRAEEYNYLTSIGIDENINTLKNQSLEYAFQNKKQGIKFALKNGARNVLNLTMNETAKQLERSSNIQNNKGRH